MVVPPHREGGQRQYVEAPVPPERVGETLVPLLDWVVEHLDRPHTVESLAVRAPSVRMPSRSRESAAMA
jgi:transcriptional regulator GlxA family with amidase domain